MMLSRLDNLIACAKCRIYSILNLKKKQPESKTGCFFFIDHRRKILSCKEVIKMR
jgi:hypothetical protein